MIENAPRGEDGGDNVQLEIDEGSFYQELAAKAIEKYQDEFYAVLQNITYGDYDPPTLDLDIELLSPKLIIYEPLLCENMTVEDKPISFIIDLGKIVAKTYIIEKQKDFDYHGTEN